MVAASGDICIFAPFINLGLYAPSAPPSNVAPVIYLEKLITLATDCCCLQAGEQHEATYYHKKKGNARNHYNSVLFLITVSRTKCTKV